MSMRFCARLLVAFVLVGLSFFGMAQRADAHASLETTQPSSKSPTTEPVKSITLQFDEAVQASSGNIRLYSADGQRVSTSSPRHPDGAGSVVAVDTGKPLKDGTYVVAWRVVSADAHPVHGAFAFTVGDAVVVNTDSLSSKLLAANGGSESVGALFAIVRFLSFVGGALLAGSALVLFWVWPSGFLIDRTKRLLWIFAGVALTSTILSVWLQGVYQQALPLGSLIDVTALSDVIRSSYGYFNGLRVVAILALGLILRLALTRGKWIKFLGTIAAIGVVVPWSFVGHAATEASRGLAMIANSLHVGAVSLWFGGLVLLALVALPKATDGDLREFARRFSVLATGCVIVILVTGSYRAWREIGSWSSLTSTPYGRLVVIKMFLFAGLIALGSWSRRFAQKHWNANGLERIVKFEVVLIVLTLLATSLLVAAAPPRTTPSTSFSAELTSSKLLVDVTVEPTRRGPTVMHLYVLSPTGVLMPVPGMTARATLPAKDVGPLPITLQQVNGSHYVSENFSWPLAGKWTVDLAVRLSDINEINLNTEITVTP